MSNKYSSFKTYKQTLSKRKLVNEKFGIDSILIQDGIHKEFIKSEEDIINLTKEFLDNDLQEIVTIKHL